MIGQDIIANWLNTSFIGGYIRSPRQVGAIAPSSARLARAMTDQLTARDGPVLELGPGTGVITEALLDRGFAPNRIAAIELSDRFTEHLSASFPQIAVIQGDATQIHHLSPFAAQEPGVVICGLPLVSMPSSSVFRILERSFRCLRPDGQFRLFTYGPRCPISSKMRHRLGLTANRCETVLRNVPPATVYVLRQDKTRTRNGSEQIS